MTETGWAKPGDRQEIIDFIDYVFSKAHRPHDFATLLPKLYGKAGDAEPHHFLVREDGRIAAAILAYPVVMHAGGRQLMTVGVGSVSVHPRARGKGYMQLLMQAVDQHARKLDAAFAVLGGNRQRYQYFGYQYGGYQLSAQLLERNVRHALADADDGAFSFAPMTQAHVPQALALHERQACRCARTQENLLDVLRSWNNQPTVILRDGKPAGFGTMRKNRDSLHIAELLLEDEGDFPAVMKMLGKAHGTLTIAAAPWQKERAAWLTAVCEGFEIRCNNAYKIYQPQLVREVFGEGRVDFDGFTLPLPLFVAPPDCV